MSEPIDFLNAEEAIDTIYKRLYAIFTKHHFPDVGFTLDTLEEEAKYEIELILKEYEIAILKSYQDFARDITVQAEEMFEDLKNKKQLKS